MDDSDGGSIDYSSGIQLPSTLEPNSVTTNSRVPEPSVPGGQSEHILSDNPMPKSIKKLIKEWSDRVGPSFQLEDLPCAVISIHSSLTNAQDRRPATWKHFSGKILTVYLYPLRPTELSAKINHRRPRIIVARGHDLGPFMIAYRQGGSYREGASYRIWKGVTGDKLGFENGASVTKVFLPKTTIPGTSRFKGDLSSTDRKVSLPASPKADPEKMTLRLGPDTRKRKREESDASVSNVLLQRTPSKHLRSRDASASTPTFSVRPGSNAVESHIKSNLVLLLRSPNSPVPRIRLFSACDSVQNLFAQAMAGDVVDDSESVGPKGGGARVLAMQFGGVRSEKEVSKNILVVEDDEEDFESLVKAIKAKDWWTTMKGATGVEGSGIVEVRGKGMK